MKKLSYLIVLILILGLALAGCTFLSNIGQAPATDQSGITYLTKSFPNLVGLWHFDEGSGGVTTVADSSGYGNDGTVYGATTGVLGKFGNALSFDGDDDYVQLPASSTILNTSTFTIEAWFKTSVNHPVYGSLDGIGEGRIVNLARDTAGFTAVALYVEQDNIAICYHTGTAFKHLRYAVDYHGDTWHHIAVTRDSTTYRLYYDGAEVASQSDAFVGFGTSAAYLGTFYPITTIDPIKRFFNGTIDEVRIWNIARTEFQLEPVVVAMDIKPGSCPNPLNVKSQGVLPVAILGTEDFDVTQVDPASITLAGVSPLRWALEDVATPNEDSEECNTRGPDGYLDLTLKFDTQEVVTALGSVKDGDIITLTLTGTLLDGITFIEGYDVIIIIKKGK